jgi:tetratricopeptide (TPR) repeat protein/serine/threonine protein kinase
MNERDLFTAALQITDPAERSAWLDRECGGDAALRARIEVLLQALGQAGSLLENPLVVAVGSAPAAEGNQAGLATADFPMATAQECPGTVIGPYKLLEQIGESGFGVVFMAEQQHPVRRKVALKVIKPGMDTRQVIARFEAERQALALMEHPNIARVLDAGTTGESDPPSESEPRTQRSGVSGGPAESLGAPPLTPLRCVRGSDGRVGGRPYFVMELVRGLSMTEYCDQHNLPVRERLELFLDVCQAVQHAHQKGIIHHDIKPSNVLVTLHDGKPVVKIIDFGIAKAMGQQLTEKTLFTNFAQMIGTPLYMSPEQAEMSGLDVDTRSDIYSLGVLLYELLTGTTPFDKERLKTASFDEIRRIIREEEPPKPSTRMSTVGQAATTASEKRQSDPRKLSRLFRGELDWIVMKALEKDRNRRYDTASAFAADVERYLKDEAVQACPPSMGYRFRKFARRNKRTLTTASALALAVLVAVGSITGSIGWGMRDRAARRTVLEQAVLRALEETETASHRDRLPEASAALKRAEELLASGECREELRARVRQSRADLDLVDRLEAIRLRRATIVDGKFDYRTADREYAAAFGEADLGVEGEEAEAVAARVRALAVWEQLVATLDDWAEATKDPKRQAWLLEVARHADPDPWRDRFRDPKVWRDRAVLEALAAELLRDEAQLGKQKPQLLNTLGLALESTKADSVPLLAAAQARHPDDFWLNFDLGNALLSAKQWNEAVGYYRGALAVRPDAAVGHNNLGYALSNQKKLHEGIACCRKAIALDPKYVLAHINLGNALLKQGKLDEAFDYYKKAVVLDPNDALAHDNLGAFLCDCKHDYDGAIAEFLKDIALDPNLASAHFNLGYALHDQGKLEKAIAWYQKAIALDPKYARAHYSLGYALKDVGDLDGAFAEYHEAIRLKPDDHRARLELGNVRKAKGDLEGAMVEFQKAIALKPDYAEAHCNLGIALKEKGEFRQALEECGRGHELGSKDPGWRYPSAEWVRQCERLIELDGKLPGFLDGTTTPAGPAERVELAGLCAVKRLDRAAARFYEDAFAAEPKLADDLGAWHRYSAACAAALAGCGVGKDADKLDETDKARLRGQALGWLRADFESWTKEMAKNTTEARTAVREKMQHWQADPDLAAVRGPDALAKLPEAERQPWQNLWNDVADMLKLVQGKDLPEKK